MKLRLPPMINDVATGRTPEYPDIVPLDLDIPPDEALARVERVARAMDGWRRIRVDRATRTLEAEAVTPLFRFVDDVTIEVEPHGAGSRIQMRSRSRLGKGDLGTNAKRIRAFFARLAALG